MDQNSPNNRISIGYRPELNGLRGIAILSVMACHTGLPIFAGGFIGVDIFFVLSGFLITSLLVSEFDERRGIGFRRFYVNRVLRLGPALACLLIVLIGFSWVALTREQLVDNVVDSLITLFYVANWARAFELHPPLYLGHTWSLSIEEQFYILWPVLLVALLRHARSRATLTYAIVFLSIAAICWRVFLTLSGESVERLYNGLDTHADGLLIGCALGAYVTSNLLTDRQVHRLRKVLKVLAPFSALGLLVVAATTRWTAPVMYYAGLLVVELLTAVLILDVFVSDRSVVKRLLAARWLVWTGMISYGLYLWHFPVFHAVALLRFGYAGYIGISVCLTFLIAIASYYLLELRFLKKKVRYSDLTPVAKKGNLWPAENAPNSN